jgi:hypothetical protein
MSVPSENNIVTYPGNGSQTVFPYTYRVLDADSLQVVLQLDDGSEEVQSFGTQYTVTGVGDYAGGSIQMAIAPLAGERITIRRKIPAFTQDVDLRNQGAFYAETHEDVFDRIIMMLQQLKTDVDRSAKVTITTAALGFNPEFPNPNPMKMIGWNEDATALVNHDFGTLYDGKIIQGGFYNSNGDPISEEEAVVINAGTY